MVPPIRAIPAIVAHTNMIMRSTATTPLTPRVAATDACTNSRTDWKNPSSFRTTTAPTSNAENSPALADRTPYRGVVPGTSPQSMSHTCRSHRKRKNGRPVRPSTPSPDWSPLGPFWFPIVRPSALEVILTDVRLVWVGPTNADRLSVQQSSLYRRPRSRSVDTAAPEVKACLLADQYAIWAHDVGDARVLRALRFLITTQAKRNLSSRSGIGGVLSAT